MAHNKRMGIRAGRLLGLRSSDDLGDGGDAAGAGGKGSGVVAGGVLDGVGVVAGGGVDVETTTVWRWRMACMAQLASRESADSALLAQTVMSKPPCRKRSLGHTGEDAVR